jgi:hypothetical protein
VAGAISASKINFNLSRELSLITQKTP